MPALFRLAVATRHFYTLKYFPFVCIPGLAFLLPLVGHQLLGLNIWNTTRVLLRHNYAMKKIVFPKLPPGKFITYASCGHSGKKSWFFTQRRWRKSQKKTFFCSAISGLCPLWTNKSTGDQSTGLPQLFQTITIKFLMFMSQYIFKSQITAALF